MPLQRIRRIAHAGERVPDRFDPDRFNGMLEAKFSLLPWIGRQLDRRSGINAEQLLHIDRCASDQSFRNDPVERVAVAILTVQRRVNRKAGGFAVEAVSDVLEERRPRANIEEAARAECGSFVQSADKLNRLANIAPPISAVELFAGFLLASHRRHKRRMSGMTVNVLEIGDQIALNRRQ